MLYILYLALELFCNFFFEFHIRKNTHEDMRTPAIEIQNMHKRAKSLEMQQSKTDNSNVNSSNSFDRTE